ncbi:MAG: serine hydrolase [Candidatus Izemoplasmatales bacterium]|nr:serine hydrolase [Candidatus Izemoplasmatales bacterium]
MVFPHQEFEKASCRDANIEKGLLADMFVHIEKENWNIHSMLLVKDGTKIFDAYADQFEPHHREEVYSISKSFTSIAIGICQDRGLLSIQDNILDYFPEQKKSALPEYQNMTIQHLLMMASGQERDLAQSFDDTEDPIAAFFQIPVIHPLGEVFFYNNGCTFMLSAIVSKVTGLSLNDFLEVPLWNVLEIKKPVWDEIKGISVGAFGLKASTIDLAKFGLLLLNEGRWKETQVVSKEYVKEATSKHIETTGNGNPRDVYGYGYQFWMNDFGDYRAAGWLKQYIVINKEYQVVFVTQAYEEHELLNLFDGYILPALQKGWLYDNVSLRDYIRSFHAHSIPIIAHEKATRK